jgi:hypothetical protein
MNEITAETWEATNQSRLMAALDDLSGTLTALLASGEAGPRSPPVALDDPPALRLLCETFGLSGFERNILLMCAGVELDSSFASLCAALNKDRGPGPPTFSLALAAFSDAHWSALLPSRPLRHWHLVEVQRGEALTTSALRIDERILHFITGMRTVDERLRSLLEPKASNGPLLQSELTVAHRVADSIAADHGQNVLPAVQLCGTDAAGRRRVAAAACALIGLDLDIIAARSVPQNTAETDLFVRLWEREAALHRGVLLLEYDDSRTLDGPGEAAAGRLIETLRAPLFLSVRERIKPADRPVRSFDVPGPTAAEQIDLWQQTLGDAAPSLATTIEALVSQFSLDAGGIQAAAAEAALRPEQRERALWDACRGQSRPRLEGLAQRLAPSAAWDDLVLPEKQKQLLAQIVIHVRQRRKVMTTWGFAAKNSRGLGISAVFSGPSGTGKTMAGEVLANELRLDLYRIDLSQVISKYIGETEKTLRRVFDAADDGGAILLFDEADALFGKRSEVKDSHDRYANIEVSYLLQRMETYRGLAILTTNRKEALDTAFLRRIRFAIEFPFPEAPQRAEMWRTVFPSQTPTEGLRIDRLARLSAAGGNIQNIAMGAAFLAADAEEPVRMSHLLSAAHAEFAKIERPLTEMETAGWV